MKKLSLFSIVLLMLSMCISADAQTSAHKVLRQHTEKQLSEIIGHSPAVTGLVAVDLTTGDTFSFNADVIFPQASAIKIPILMSVYKQAHEGKFTLSDSRKVERADVVGGTGILKDLADTPSMSIRDLGVLMISLSDNTATNSLIELVSMQEINAMLRSVGAKKTIVQRKMINSAASGRGEENLSTPADAAHILQLLYRGEFINKASSDEFMFILKKTDRQTSRLAVGLPGDVPIAFKPGVLNGVSTEWAIVLLPERPYAVAVMESFKVKGQSQNTVEELSEVLYQYFWRTGNATRYGTYVDPKHIK
ncbi:serine hydrolase [Pontibacter anaerobius]|uniref:beta-lactamase n=1 Tax=Pontibacter anaerobius TaxID=2993940 RepID=A0ABT3RFG7_9BACT|nr:serine hydrolase [Pontibacter anaerobius]MCX2740374.1 class A beta-lactamase-related serine hydrolase [Pontibacter anaerobius]